MILILTVQYGHAQSNYTQPWVHSLREKEEDVFCVRYSPHRFNNEILFQME